MFDAYGTLFDVHSPIRHHAGELGSGADAVSVLWRSKQLEYTWLRSLMGRYVDFGRVTADALDHALERYGTERPELRQRLLDAYLTLDPYPEVVEVLGQLGAAGVRSAVLSNGSPAMLQAAVAHAGLSGLVDPVISVDEVGVYKPDPRVYQLAVEHLGVPADRICFLSSNAWDAAGAASFGFQVVWVNRFGQPPERLGHPPHLELPELGSLPEVLAPSAP